MRHNLNLNEGTAVQYGSFSKAIKSLFVLAFFLTCIQVSTRAQEATFTRPSLWVGIAGGGNSNFYQGSTQRLNADVIAPVAFHNGTGLGLFVLPLIEFHAPASNWGIMLQAGYDSRRGSFNQIMSPCNCPRDLSTRLGYISVEPSLRFAPFKSNFYLFGGPRLAFNIQKSFTYVQGTNPAYPEQVAPADITGDLSDMKSLLVSAQIGAGYDIPLSSQERMTQWVLSPFISFQPYFGQSPRTIETLSVTTLRVGAALKIGRGHKIVPPAAQQPTAIAEPKVRFSVNAPKNIPVERKVRELFPLRNYVFFDLGSTEIPDRYVLLKSSQVKDFKEDQLDLFTPKNLSGRSRRQMIVYYNVLNILGDRMGKNPSATITLVGSSEKGAEDGRAMAESIKTYLANVFGIDAMRITTEGRTKPVIPSQQPGNTQDITLVREDDRRVSIESNSPVLLMEFQVGPNAPLKPVEILGVQDAPLDSYVTFTSEGATEAFSSWALEITDPDGKLKNYGPFTNDNISIPGKTIMGSREAGEYKVVMVGQTKSGKTVKKESSVNMVLWTPSPDIEAKRFSVIYEFDESKTINIYEKYILEIVVPKIPQGGKVIIHGHTDIIGEEGYNSKLSIARANDVRKIIEKGLATTGRTDVSFEEYGFGEDTRLSQFENNFPEQRFYNRTVIIDIIPAK